jgi:hypothetical protein
MWNAVDFIAASAAQFSLHSNITMMALYGRAEL